MRRIARLAASFVAGAVGVAIALSVSCSDSRFTTTAPGDAQVGDGSGADDRAILPSSDGGMNDGALGAIVTLATGQNRPRGMAIDDTHAYWANEGNGTIVAVAKAGGAVEIFATDASEPAGVASDVLDVFWPSNTYGQCSGLDGLWRKAKMGGNATNLRSCTDSLWKISAIAVDGTYLFWTYDAVYAIPKAGGGASLIASPGGSPAALAVGATAVYWTNPPLKNVGFYSKLDGGVGVLASGQQGLAAIATDGDYAYFTTFAAVLRVPTSGGEPEPLGPALNGPIALALTSNDVFVANAGDGTIVSINKASGAATTIAAGESGARSIAVDESGVYWTTDSGTVRKRAFL